MADALSLGFDGNGDGPMMIPAFYLIFTAMLFTVLGFILGAVLASGRADDEAYALCHKLNAHGLTCDTEETS